MDKRFANLFNLTEEEAIARLRKPLDQLQEKSERYVAASYLSNFPSQKAIAALIETIEESDSDLYHRIARRKSLESLGRLKAQIALPTIRACLQDADPYTVENAVWAIGQIGTEEEDILADITAILSKPQQSYRLIIHTLAKLGYQPALAQIKPFTDSEDLSIASAAISACIQLTNDYSEIDKIVELLKHSNVNVRRACLQDLIDTKYYPAIPQIVKSPVSVAFRLRAVKTLAESGITANKITFKQIEASLDQIILDHPHSLEMVHEYDQLPTIEFALQELYHTDFGRCYLASQTLLEAYPQIAPAALITNYQTEGYKDYGAHYHIIKILGWLQYQPAKAIFLTGLKNQQPQFQKSRAASALALAQIGATDALEELKAALKTKIFDLKYASLLALTMLGEKNNCQIALADEEILIREKAAAILKMN